MGKEEKKVKNPKGKITFLLAFLVICVLVIAQILVANRLVAQGDLIKKCETEAYWLKEENQRMENEIIKLSSLTSIASRSAELAFKKETSVLYLPRPVTVALREK